MIDYALVKSVHIGLVAVSGALFAARGLGMLLGSGLGMRPAVRMASYLIDTGLLAAAVALLFLLRLNPLTTSWLAVKLLLLVAYIVLGSLALKRGRNYGIRTLSLIAAVFCFSLMYSVARQHDPLGFFSQFWR